MESAIIEIQGLVKQFGKFRALDELDLTVEAGQVHGFLGPNGAGKSTTLRALLGLLRTDGGTARVFGLDSWRDSLAIHRRLAYVPGDVALWPNLGGGETIDLLLRLRGIDPARSRRNELIERFQLDPTKKGRAYSKGNRQKIALIAAFAAPTELLLLDEPTSGLDPLMEQIFRDCVTEARSTETTVLLSSHLLDEVEALADHVTIVREGRAVETGTLAQMRHLRRTKVRVELGQAPARLDRIPGVHDVSIEANVLTCSVEQHGLDTLLRALSESGISALTCAPPSLEELFLDAYRRNGG